LEANSFCSTSVSAAEIARAFPRFLLVPTKKVMQVKVTKAIRTGSRRVRVLELSSNGFRRVLSPLLIVCQYFERKGIVHFVQHMM